MRTLEIVTRDRRPAVIAVVREDGSISGDPSMTGYLRRLRDRLEPGQSLLSEVSKRVTNAYVFCRISEEG